MATAGDVACSGASHHANDATRIQSLANRYEAYGLHCVSSLDAEEHAPGRSHEHLESDLSKDIPALLDVVANTNVDMLNAVSEAMQTATPDTFAIAEAIAQMDVANGAIVEIFSLTPDDLP